MNDCKKEKPGQAGIVEEKADQEPKGTKPESVEVFGSSTESHKPHHWEPKSSWKNKFYTLCSVRGDGNERNTIESARREGSTRGKENSEETEPLQKPESNAVETDGQIVQSTKASMTSVEAANAIETNMKNSGETEKIATQSHPTDITEESSQKSILFVATIAILMFFLEFYRNLITIIFTLSPIILWHIFNEGTKQIELKYSL